MNTFMRWRLTHRLKGAASIAATSSVVWGKPLWIFTSSEIDNGTLTEQCALNNVIWGEPSGIFVSSELDNSTLAERQV